MTTKKQPKKQSKPMKAQRAAVALTRKARADRAKAPAPAPLVPGPGEIVVTNGKGPMLVKALRVFDYFALHAPVGGGKGHALTHVPTGRPVSSYRTKGLALWVAEQLRAAGGDELWAFTDPTHMLKSAKQDMLARLRRLADPVSAEADMRQAQDPGGARIAAAAKVLKAAGVPLTPTSTRHSADPVEPPRISAPWRAGIDWVAAGKKAYETRLRNLAAKQAAPPPPPPVKKGARS